ncbi:3973_t:CDS:2 [Paraglomus occultum]|uniref:3973_t:CDS:1 n=1 Tax=Paraglomus occultum TaxID=144539 RepID=A0A9N9B3M3_9GLOM|nr:3973_t:CDS:2 [Paraglomus occultum]
MERRGHFREYRILQRKHNGNRRSLEQMSENGELDEETDDNSKETPIVSP